MILNKGLWILVNIDGIDGALSQTYKGQTYLTLVGPEREVGNPWSAYTPFDKPPGDDDTSSFANVYRKLGTLVKEQKIEGPFAEENHPAVFRRFLWFSGDTPTKLLETLMQHGIVARVREIPHKGDDAEVAEAVTIFKPWMDSNTVVKPNPKIEEDRKRKEEAEIWKKRHEEAERKDNLLRKYVYLPVLVLVVLAAGYCAITSHWWLALAILLLPVFIYIGFVIWIMRRS